MTELEECGVIDGLTGVACSETNPGHIIHRGGDENFVFTWPEPKIREEEEAE